MDLSSRKPGALSYREVPLSRPDIGPREVELVNQVLQSPALSMGPMLQRFEEGVAAYVGARYGVGVANGTSGLHLCMKAAGIQPGDEVITTPFSFIASANCIVYAGGVPVFVDIDPQSLNMDPGLVEERITPRTRALLVVHVFGQPCDMGPLVEIAHRHHLALIEDACEAIGARWDGRQVGTFGDAAVFAFYPNKQMTTGEGGIVVTDREEWSSLAREGRNQELRESLLHWWGSASQDNPRA